MADNKDNSYISGWAEVVSEDIDQSKKKKYPVEWLTFLKTSSDIGDCMYHVFICSILLISTLLIYPRYCFSLTDGEYHELIDLCQSFKNADKKLHKIWKELKSLGITDNIVDDQRNWINEGRDLAADDYMSKGDSKCLAYTKSVQHRVDLLIIFKNRKLMKSDKDNPVVMEKLFIDAENGDKIAQWMFAVLLAENKLYGKAKIYYEKSSAQGFSLADSGLGKLYYYGFLGNIDYKKAKYYFELALKNDNNNVEAQCYLGSMYKYGEGIDKDYTMAKIYYEKAANHGERLALRELGKIYMEGLGGEKDYHKAFKYLKEAYDKGDSLSAASLGYLYEEGLGTRQDSKKAFMCVNNALSNGINVLPDSYRASLYNILGTYYQGGRVVKQDLNMAKELYGKSCDGGFQPGCDSYKKLKVREY